MSWQKEEQETWQSRGLQVSREERYLWSFAYNWNQICRLWWAYFSDWTEIHACIVELESAFPGFHLEEIHIRPFGLMVCKQFFAFACTRQQRKDLSSKPEARQRDEMFFPLAPLACGYLDSFLVSLGQDASLLPETSGLDPFERSNGTGMSLTSFLVILWVEVAASSKQLSCSVRSLHCIGPKPARVISSRLILS